MPIHCKCTIVYTVGKITTPKNCSVCSFNGLLAVFLLHCWGVKTLDIITYISQRKNRCCANLRQLTYGTEQGTSRSWTAVTQYFENFICYFTRILLCSFSSTFCDAPLQFLKTISRTNDENCIFT